MSRDRTIIFPGDRLYVVAIAVATSVLCSAGWAADYTRLVDSNPVPPLTAPEATTRSLMLSSAVRLAVEAGPAFNRSVVHSELQKAFDSALKEGLERASSQGQAGVLGAGVDGVGRADRSSR